MSDELDTTPTLRRPPETVVAAAKLALPGILAGIDPDSDPNGRVQADGSVVMIAGVLAKQIKDAGHSEASAKWAIHDFVVSGLLHAAPRWRSADDLPNALRGDFDNLFAVAPEAPAPYPNFVVVSMPGLWEWWNKTSSVTLKKDDLDLHCMTMAIEEARKSKSEDDRAHPKVGAVVVKDGVVVATAFRGELGNGEHAEYTVLEKKLADATLAGATVYATLEPCTNRNHPKIPCAQRLIDRRVKRVVIGMLDPNPQICGKGERLLRQHGVEVDRFPHELIMQLEDLNRDFVRAHNQANKSSSNVLVEAPIVIDGLPDLLKRFVDAQDRFPRAVSFALVMIPYDEREAWKEANAWFDDMRGPPQKDGWRCLGYESGGDSPESIAVPPSEIGQGGTTPVLYNLKAWMCWLLRQSRSAPFPADALNQFHSLTADACRLLDLRDCGMMLDGEYFAGKRGGYGELLRWSIEQLDSEDCQKWTWLNPPNHYVQTILDPGRTSSRWKVELPCVFATVANALKRHLAGTGKQGPWA